MLVELMISIYSHHIFWWVIVPLFLIALFVSFMIWESRFAKGMPHKKWF
jgi:hypothetical protein